MIINIESQTLLKYNFCCMTDRLTDHINYILDAHCYGECSQKNSTVSQEKYRYPKMFQTDRHFELQSRFPTKIYQNTETKRVIFLSKGIIFYILETIVELQVVQLPYICVYTCICPYVEDDKSPSTDYDVIRPPPQKNLIFLKN